MNRQMIGLGPPLPVFLVGTRWAVSMSWIDTADPIVFAYCMDVGEFTVDYGIEDANLIHFNEMPHKINKKAFILKVKKMQDGSSLFKGRFDFNLFKLIQDNFSNNYTIALEIYFERFPFTEKEFNSVRISFEKIYMYINHNATPIPIVNIISQY